MKPNDLYRAVALLAAGLSLAFAGQVRGMHNPYFDLHEPGIPTNSPPPPPPPPPPPCDPNKCPPDPNCKAGDPVYPANGKFYLQLTDYELPGEIPITIRRQY
jgi:hypothetical protein